MSSSEMVFANISTLQSEILTVTLFDESISLTKDNLTILDDEFYSWTGSNSDGADALLIASDTTIFGTIKLADKTFVIFPVSDSIHEVYNIDPSLLPLETNKDNTGASATSSTLDRNMISQLESAYIGDLDYKDNADIIITIDVLIAASNDVVYGDHRTLSSMARYAIESANYVYATNDLPIRLNLVDTY